MKALFRFNRAVFLLGMLLLACGTSGADVVAYWGFNEGSGTTISDGSGNGYDGTLINPRNNTWCNGVLGSALYFDSEVGSNSTRVVVSDIDIGSEFTFAAWVNTTDANRDAPIFAEEESTSSLSYWFGVYENHFGVYLDSPGGTVWDYRNRNEGSIIDGEWAHLAVTWDGSVVRYYENAGLVGSHEYSGPINNVDVSLSIGVNSVNNFTSFYGTLDEIYILDEAVDASGVALLYSNQYLTSDVPEPASLLLLALGGCAAAFRRKRG